MKNLVDSARNNYKNNSQSFKDLERQDIIAFLDIYRKLETLTLCIWIGIYRLTLVLLGRFLKWLYYPDILSDRRPEPIVMQKIGRLKRREQTTYKPTDT
ncbi:MAG: hypothetical protein ACJ707_01530 [Nitrososphaera sp.]